MMLLSISIGNGLQNTIKNKVSSFFGHVLITNFQNNNSESSLDPILIKEDLEKVFELNNINHVQSVAYKTGLVTSNTTFEGVVFKGINSDFNYDIFSDYVLHGKIPEITDSLTNQVAISNFLSKRINLEIGDKFKTSFFNANSNIPNERNFEVVGIYESGLTDFDNLYFFGDIKHIQKMNKWHSSQVGNFEIFINDFEEIESITNKLYSDTPSNLDVISISEKFPEIFNWIKLFDMNIILIIIIMILVAGGNMITALIVTILEKSQLIGVLRVMGAQVKSVRLIFLTNGIYLICIGLAFGNLIGLLLLYIQKYFGVYKLNPEIYYVSTLPVEINFITILLLNLGILFFCLLMLIIPSKIIEKISPVDAIKIK